MWCGSKSCKCYSENVSFMECFTFCFVFAPYFVPDANLWPSPLRNPCPLERYFFCATGLENCIPGIVPLAFHGAINNCRVWLKLPPIIYSNCIFQIKMSGWYIASLTGWYECKCFIIASKRLERIFQKSELQHQHQMNHLDFRRVCGRHTANKKQTIQAKHIKICIKRPARKTVVSRFSVNI